MNEKQFAKMLSQIDDIYIEEADTQQRTRSGLRPKHWMKVAAFVAIIMSGIVVAVLFGSKNGSSKTAPFLSATAAEIAKEKIQMGATMPIILYADSKKVIMYDYIGIWVYSLKEQGLVGFCDFRPIDMTQIQGDPCVFVEVTKDAKYVKFYKNDNTIKYLYDVSKNTYKEVSDYGKLEKDTYQMKEWNEGTSLSDYGYTYEMTNGDLISYTVESKGEETAVYGDLILLTRSNGTDKSYKIFDEN